MAINLRTIIEMIGFAIGGLMLYEGYTLSNLNYAVIGSALILFSLISFFLKDNE